MKIRLKQAMVTLGAIAVLLAWIPAANAQCPAPPICGPGEALSWDGASLFCTGMAAILETQILTAGGNPVATTGGCPGGWSLTGGGCQCFDGKDSSVGFSYPTGGGGWTCRCHDNGGSSGKNAMAYAICSRITP